MDSFSCAQVCGLEFESVLKGCYEHMPEHLYFVSDNLHLVRLLL